LEFIDLTAGVAGADIAADEGIGGGAKGVEEGEGLLEDIAAEFAEFGGVVCVFGDGVEEEGIAFEFIKCEGVAGGVDDGFHEFGDDFLCVEQAHGMELEKIGVSADIGEDEGGIAEFHGRNK
jgi:hypothetical protein